MNFPQIDIFLIFIGGSVLLEERPEGAYLEKNIYYQNRSIRPKTFPSVGSQLITDDN